MKRLKKLLLALAILLAGIALAASPVQARAQHPQYVETNKQGYSWLYRWNKKRKRYRAVYVLLSSPRFTKIVNNYLSKAEKSWTPYEKTWEQPYDYNAPDAVQHMLNPLPTSKPKVFVENAKDNPELVQATREAINAWKPEIQASLTQDKSQADIVVRYTATIVKGGDANTDVTDTMPRYINLYKDELQKEGTDEYGLRMTLIHEMGHAIGCQHSRNICDSMSCVAILGVSNNRKIAKYYQQPTITQATRKVVRELYHEN